LSGIRLGVKGGKNKIYKIYIEMSGKLIQLYLGDFKVDEKSTEGTDMLHEYFDAKKDWDKQLIKRILTLEYNAGVAGDKYKKLFEYEKSLKTKVRENLAEEHNNLYCFITINPRDNVKLEDFIAKVEKLVTRNMFKEYIYVFEQRGAKVDESGKGFHSHILLLRNTDYKPYKIKENSKNTFKSICDVNNPNILNIQFVGKDFAKDKQDYITACKTGEGKDVKQEIDIVWRKQKQLKDFYGNKIFV